MTAIPLFDALAREDRPAAPGGGRAAALAARLVEALLADWQRLRQFQEEFAPANWDDPAAAMEVETSIYRLFEAWAAEAEQVLVRLRRLAAAGHPVAGAEALEDACGQAAARLRFTPERMARAMEQVRRGEFTPAKELRDELRARLRA
jgi:hypothetical protein